MSPITVLLAAPDRSTRVAMRAALAGSGVRIAGEACSRGAAGDGVRACSPDVAVADANLLSIRDFFLSGWGPVSRTTRIVAVGGDDRRLARRLCAQGAAAYVARGRLDAELPAAVAGQGASRNGGYASEVSTNA